MKKIIAMLVMVFAFVTFVKADNDTPITVSELPAAAQTFVKKYFPDKKVALAKKESGFIYATYDVIFTDGNKLEFNKSGEWQEVNCQYSSVPEEIVPQKIKAYIKSNFPEAKVSKIERDSREYEVKLSNHTELKFDMQFRLIDIDMD